MLYNIELVSAIHQHESATEQYSSKWLKWYIFWLTFLVLFVIITMVMGMNSQVCFKKSIFFTKIKDHPICNLLFSLHLIPWVLIKVLCVSMQIWLQSIWLYESTMMRFTSPVCWTVIRLPLISLFPKDAEWFNHETYQVTVHSWWTFFGIHSGRSQINLPCQSAKFPHY